MLLACASAAVMAEDGAPSLTKKKMTIKVGQLASVQVKNLPAGGKVTFKSGNKKVVKVSKKGKLTPKKAGKAVIKATVKYNGKSKTLKCTVKVKPAIVALK